MRGTIERVALNDFMCFNSVEFLPGCCVNLVVAPNGCGKSSFIVAIILGLGGRVQDVARGKYLGTYVRAGCSTAKIEIQLNNGNNGSVVINRIIQHDNKSWFTLNGSRVAHREIDELMKQMNIQIDNLCQVLPQDRVYEFSCLDSHALLESTERSIGPGNLAVYHEKLKALAKEKKELDECLDQTEENAANLREQTERMKEQIQKKEKKRNLLTQIETLKQKYAWKEYQRQYSALRQLQNDETNAKEVVQRLRDEQRRELEKIEELKIQSKSCASQVYQKVQEMRLIRKEVNGLLSQRDRAQDGIELVREEHKEHILNLKNKQEQLTEQKLHLSKLENDLLALSQNSDEEQKQKLKALKIQLKEEFAFLTLANQDENTVQIEILNLTRNIKAQEKVLRDCEDTSRMRLLSLQRTNSDVHQAVLWLRKNRHHFQSNIYEPMMLEINLLDPRYATFLEATVPARDLLAFTCDDLNDMNSFVNVVRGELKLGVSVVYSGSEHRSLSSFNPTVPMKELSKYGFTMFVQDMFTAPEAIMKYLCRNYGIHNLPVGSNQVDAKFDGIPIPRFYSQKSKYQSRTSVYSGKRIFSITSLSPATFLTFNNRLRVEEIQLRISELQKKRDELKPTLAEVQERIRCIEKRMEVLRENRRNLQSSADSKQVLICRIKSRKEQIVSIENNNIDFDAEKRSYPQKLMCYMNKLLDIHEQIVQHALLIAQHTADIRHLQLMESIADAAHVQAKTDVQNTMARCTEQEAILQHIQLEISNMVEKAQFLHTNAMALTGEVPPLEFFSKGSSEEMLLKIQELQVEADFVIDGNDTEFQDYENQTNELELLQQQVQQMKKKQGELRQNIEEVQKQWLPQLEDIVEKINVNYTRYFTELGCCGEVLLFKPLDISAYDKYGIVIKVKFRNADPLTELNQHTQSGGERSVATALYMIALQQLTCVPFRIVDEINQGMDPVNERKMFEILVRVTQVRGAAQYFLITPKLLLNLQYPDNLAVMTICVNQETLNQDWNIDDSVFHSLLKKEQRQSDEY